MDDQDKGPPWNEWVSEKGERIFLLAGDEPLPDGVKQGDEGVFVIRLVAATREMVEAENVAYLR